MEPKFDYRFSDNPAFGGMKTKVFKRVLKSRFSFTEKFDFIEPKCYPERGLGVPVKKFVTLRRLLLALALIFAVAFLDWHINTRFDPASIESKLVFIANELGTKSAISVPRVEILEKTEFSDAYIKKSQNQTWAKIFQDTFPGRANGQLGFYTENTIFFRKDKTSDLALAHELGHHAFYALFQKNPGGLQTDNEEALVTELAEKYMSQKSPTLKILYTLKSICSFVTIDKILMV